MPFKDPKRRLEYHRKYNKAHQKEASAKAHVYRIAHLEQMRKRDRDYSAWNRNRKKAYDATYFVKNRSDVLQRNLDYKHTLRMQILTKFGNKCANPFNLLHPDWCNDPKCLQIDHIDGNGNHELRHLETSRYYKKVLADNKGEYQLLCANCNWIKRAKNKKEHGGASIHRLQPRKADLSQREREEGSF
jgi:hypothetical protein